MVIGFAPGPAGPYAPGGHPLRGETQADRIWEHECADDFNLGFSPSAMGDVHEFMYLTHIAILLWTLAVSGLLLSWLASRVFQREDWWAWVKGIAVLCLLMSLGHVFNVAATTVRASECLILTLSGIVARFFFCTGDGLMNTATRLIVTAVGSQSVRPLLWFSRAVVVYAFGFFPLAILVPLCAAEIVFVGLVAPPSSEMGLSALSMTIALIGCACCALPAHPPISKGLQQNLGRFRDRLAVVLLILFFLFCASLYVNRLSQNGTRTRQFGVSASLLPVAIARRLLRIFANRAGLGVQYQLICHVTFGRAVEQPEILAVAAVVAALGFTIVPPVLLAIAAAEKQVGAGGALVICIASIDLICFLGTWLAAEVSAAVRWSAFGEVVLSRAIATCTMQADFSVESEDDGARKGDLAELDFRGDGVINRAIRIGNVMHEGYNVAFKVEVPAPYAVTPRLCTLKPGESQKLRVVRRAGGPDATHPAELRILACTRASIYPIEDQGWASITDRQERRVALRH